MTYLVVIEGQTIPVPEEIGQDDARVKAALAPYFPDAANAMLTRVTEGETVKINVVKRAGSKGAGPVDYLENCNGGQNPAIALYLKLKDVSLTDDPEDLVVLTSQVDSALQAGEADVEAVEAALKRLTQARPAASPLAVMGF